MGRTSDARQKLLEVAFDLIWNNSYGSVSVDQICERANVKKGSFYHFFESKCDLAVTTYEEHWQAKQPEMDRIFSPQVPPLERISKWCGYIYEWQKKKAEQLGHVCGCPYSSVGGEVATQDDKIRAKSEEMMVRMTKYLESTLTDAKAEDLIECADIKAAAKQVNSYILGAMLQAKIQNEVEVLKNLEPTIMSIIGAKKAASV